MMDSNKRRFKVTFNAPVILGFTIVCFIVLILDQVTVKASTNLLFSVYRSSLLSPFTYIRFFGHVLRLLGASGVVFALILLSSLTSIKEGEIPLTFILVAVIYIGQQIFQGVFIKDNVSNLTHIVGGVVGSCLGFVMYKHKMNRY